MEVIKRLKNEKRLKAELKRMSTVVAKHKKRPYENGRSFDVHNATYSGTIEPGRSCRINIKHVDVHPQGRATLTLHFPDRPPISLSFRGNGGLQFFDSTPERQLRDRNKRWGKNTRLNLYGGVLRVNVSRIGDEYVILHDTTRDSLDTLGVRPMEGAPWCDHGCC